MSRRNWTLICPHFDEGLGRLFFLLSFLQLALVTVSRLTADHLEIALLLAVATRVCAPTATPDRIAPYVSRRYLVNIVYTISYV